ncbi:virulence protein [Sphingomonas sp. ID1715]|nr:toprim domain-containing protein [Sphingomonas sp. ID1715]NNM78057.1 virulence protein [Sphingomonas sp. ID1715]
MSSNAPSLDAEGRAIVEELGGQWRTNGGMCRCPAHSDRTPSLSVRPGHRRLLFHCFAGCEAALVIQALRALRIVGTSTGGGGDIISPPAFTKSLAPLAARIWSEARPADGTLTEAYLQSRGIDLLPTELRFHPRAPQGRAPLTSFRPAMIAAVRDDSGLIAVHRTFLAFKHDSLLCGSPSKLALGRLGKGAVRLAPPRDDILGLAEGIETALSAWQLFNIPCWAALGTERFRHVAIPSSVRQLTLFLDNDAAGRRAERLCREAHREAGLSIEARYPNLAGQDWNDVLQHELGLSDRAHDREESKAVA